MRVYSITVKKAVTWPSRLAARGVARIPALAVATALVVACGGGDEEIDAAANIPPPAGGSNQAPTISGSPPGSVMQNTAYDFTPSAGDPNGDVLTFSVVNRPSWGTFNRATGRLSGTPTASDVRSYPNIQISVSDGELTTNLATFTINVVATTGGTATLSWTPPTQNTDGSPLVDLAGYRVYWGTSSGNYPQSVTVMNPGITSYMVEQLTPATYYFVATALDASGNESKHSNVATKTIQ
jgi:Putative Ig domain